MTAGQTPPSGDSPRLALSGANRAGPLAGIVVVEIVQTFAGEFAGGLLSDLGATVVKLEPPGGSPLRRRGPAVAGETSSLYFLGENRGKLSVETEWGALSQDGWIARLLESADAIVEDLGPGQLELHGLSLDRLWARNPRVALLRLSPFGQTGSLAGERGDDRIAQAFSGVQFATGFPDREPINVTVPLCECWAALHGAGALLMAIFHARRSGQGQVVDLGLYQTAVRLQEDVVVRYQRTGAVASRMGTESATVVPANVYRTRDGGWIAVSGAGDQPFARLCEVIGHPDAPKDPRFATATARVEHRAAADRLVASFIAEHDLADVETRFAAAGVTGTAVRSVDEILADAHVKARESVVTLRSLSGREFAAPAPVPAFSRTRARADVAAPHVGEHTDAVREAVERARVEPSGSGLAAAHRAPADDPAEAAGPLAGVRVLDLSQWLAGPAATAMLADFGAEVIMIELPSSGAAPEGQGRNSPGFVVTNRNKKSVTLDIRAPRGREAFLALVKVSDVVVENFRPGTLERYDLAPATLLDVNPRLVVVRSSGFGQTGPNAGRAAFNPVGLAFGGMTYLNGWPDRPPIRDGVTAGDYSNALFNALGAMAALVCRDRDGQGQVVDTAMYEAALRLTGDQLAVRSALGIRRERAAGDWSLYSSCATVAAADGRFVTVSAASWSELAAGLARLGWAASEVAEAVRDELAKRMRALDAVEAVRLLRGAGIAASAVNSVADLVREPHLWSRGDLVRLAHPTLGNIVTQGVTPSFSRTPGRVRGWSPSPGSDNETVLGGLLGYTPEQIRLAAEPPAKRS